MNTPPSHRARIIAAVRDRLSRIQRVNGFRTDAGLCVVVGIMALGPDDASAAICIVPGPTQPLGSGMNEHQPTTLPLQIAAVARVNNMAHISEAWLTAEAVVADVVAAMEDDDDDRTLGGLVHGDLRRGVVEPLERDSGLLDVGLLVNYEAPYRTTWGCI